MRQQNSVILCPGQGAQVVGMGRQWAEARPPARAVFEEADRVLDGRFDKPLSEICFEGPVDVLNRTDISQPAIYTCSVASYRGLFEGNGEPVIVAAAGLSLGEYTALHLTGVFDFADGLRLVAERGRLMQEAAEQSRGSMVALIGAEEGQAEDICARAAGDGVLVCANYNAPGQIVLSGSLDACERATAAASDLGLRASPLTVAGAFHSPLMQPAADQMANTLADVSFQPPRTPVWSNVTARPHDPENMELLRQRLVEQIVSPVRWAQLCQALVSEPSGGYESAYHELAPGSVLRGLMRRIDRKVKVTTHEEP